MARTRLVITWEKASPRTLAVLEDLMAHPHPGDRIGWLVRRAGFEVDDPDDARLEGITHRHQAHPI